MEMKMQIKTATGEIPRSLTSMFPISRDDAEVKLYGCKGALEASLNGTLKINPPGGS